MWTTEVPGTGFSFGALYSFLLIVSIFILLVQIATRHSEGGDTKK